MLLLFVPLGKDLFKVQFSCVSLETSLLSIVKKAFINCPTS